MEACTIGLDYGSLSCRGLLVRLRDGVILGEAEFAYPHGVFTEALPDGTKLPPLWALQDPEDYVSALEQVVPALLVQSGAKPQQVVGLCLATTASTVVAVDANWEPLCKRLPGEKHAWAKMWKHHAAGQEAADLSRELQSHPALDRCGGAIGPEFLLPKVLETRRKAPEVYVQAETFLEYGDWLASLLTGHEIRSGTYLTCKSLFDPEMGYPRGPLMDSITEKLAFRRDNWPIIGWPGQSVGTLCPQMAQKLGLRTETVVSAPQMDGYAGLPGSGIDGPGQLALVLGTSNSFLLLDRTWRKVPGICAAMPDSIFPGYVGYAAGQASAGDTLRWFVENCVPGRYERAAAQAGLGIHAYLTGLASRRPDTGLLALDWWNGNKSLLNDPNLSGLLVGMTLNTRPEDLYRALIEASAFGARYILERFRESGVPVRRIVASGGIAPKNPMLVQIYADVLGMPISVSPCTQAAALGAAMFAAVAAGADRGGYSSMEAAVRAMAPKNSQCYTPGGRDYEASYQEYVTLHNYFGLGENRVMERLKEEVQ